MIDHWLSERGRKAIEKKGWPCWGNEFIRLNVDVTDEGAVWFIEEWRRTSVTRVLGWHRDEAVDNHVALCLLREDARACLLDHGMFVYPSTHSPGKFGVIDMRAHAEGNQLITRSPGSHFDDLDEALIEALLAMTEEGEGDG